VNTGCENVPNNAACAGLSDQCSSGVCDPSSLTADDVTGCTKSFLPSGFCDDSLFCTINDGCNGSGECTGQPKPSTNGVLPNGQAWVAECSEITGGNVVHVPYGTKVTIAVSGDDAGNLPPNGSTFVQVLYDNLATLFKWDPPPGVIFNTAMDPDTVGLSFVSVKTGQAVIAEKSGKPFTSYPTACLTDIPGSGIGGLVVDDETIKSIMAGKPGSVTNKVRIPQDDTDGDGCITVGVEVKPQ